MKLLICFCLLLAPLLLRAEELQGDLYGIDAAASSVTIAANAKLTTYRVRPGGEITINGVKAKLTDLNTGMAAKITSAEPTIATKITAVGIPKTGPDSSLELLASAKQIEDLGAMLKDSKWDMKGGKSFTLHANGTANASWHRTQGYWKVTGLNKIDMHISFAKGPPERVTVSADGNFLRWGKESAMRMKQ